MITFVLWLLISADVILLLAVAGAWYYCRALKQSHDCLDENLTSLSSKYVTKVSESHELVELLNERTLALHKALEADEESTTRISELCDMYNAKSNEFFDLEVKFANLTKEPLYRRVHKHFERIQINPTE